MPRDLPPLPPGFTLDNPETHPVSGRPVLHNDDGSISTEESITITDPRINAGAPTNIPSIWGGSRPPDGLDDAQKEDWAIQQAMASGQQFRAFPSIDEAVSAAQMRTQMLSDTYDQELPPLPEGFVLDSADTEQKSSNLQSMLNRFGGSATMGASQGGITPEIAGAITRGAAPIAVGAAVGAAAGAPLAGVGAIPGAAAGAGAAALTTAIGDPVVSTVNRLLGTQYTLPTDALNDLFTRLGVAEPQSEAARVIQAASAGGAGGLGAVGIGQALSGAGAPLARAVGGVMAEAPAAQAVGGITGGAAGQEAAEAGLGVPGQIGASILAGALGANAAARVAGEMPTPSTARPAPAPRPDASTVGAEQAQQSIVRQAKASELPVPIKLTAGQRTRDFDQTRFERETAKSEAGKPIRERMSEQSQQLAQNLDAMIDQTGSRGAETNFRRVTGEVASDYLERLLQRQKAKVNVLYRRADQKGELNAPVEIPKLAEFLNENRAMQEMVPLLRGVVKQMQVSDVGSGSLPNGTVRTKPMTIKDAETLRQFINHATDYTDPRQSSFAGRMKDIIDDATAGAGGDAYKAARAARVEQRQLFEDVGLVKNLLGTKRNSTDRQIAYEDMLDKVISTSTPTDSVDHLRNLLTNPKGKRKAVADEGKQVWGEIQGGTLQWIREQALSNMSIDEMGVKVPSAAKLERAISSLDKDGKLDVIFEPKQAETLRILNDVAKDVLTVPPGSVNTSGTASVLLAALADTALSASVGVPAPVASVARAAAKQIKDRKLRARVEAALRGEIKK